MKFTNRKMQVPEDYAEVAKVMSVWQSDPVTVQMLREEDEKIPETGNLWTNEAGKVCGFDRLRLVAVLDTGELVGYGGISRAPWTEPGELWHSVIVLPEYRRAGIGTAIFRQLEDWAQGIGAEFTLQSVRHEDESSIRFAKERGYEVERSTFESKLELKSFDRPDLESVIGQV